MKQFPSTAVGGWSDRLASNRWTSFSSTTVRITLVLMHVAALSAFFFPPNWIDISLFIGLYLATGFGIAIGFHRLLTHKGFVCSRLLTWSLAFLGTAAMQGGPLWWVSVHRRHHQTSDLEDDPHTPIESLWHGHLGWMFMEEGLPRYPELSKDLARDKFLRWLDRGVNSGVPWVATAVFCFLVGGLSGVVWGAIVRTVFVWHATWCVNSVCHRWGSRPHQTRERSGNVWWVGLWALGEGWHNNHHAHPRAALHTHHWWEIDPSGYVIRLLERLRLVSKVVRAAPRQKTTDTVEAVTDKLRKASTLVVLAACVFGGVAVGQTKRGRTTPRKTTGGRAARVRPKVPAPAPPPAATAAATTTPSGLTSVITRRGEGRQPKAGETVVVHYTGVLSNGIKFDSSHDRNEPFAFKLGAGQVIKGWDEGIANLHVGDRAALIIPPQLGYGSKGAGGVIPPDATLIFIVELMDVKETSLSEVLSPTLSEKGIEATSLKKN